MLRNLRFVVAPETKVEEEKKTKNSGLPEKVEQALALRVEKEMMRMVPSLAKEQAFNRFRARLDAYRAAQAIEASELTLETVLESFAAINTISGKAIEKHPELEAEIWETTMALREKLKGTPTLVLLSSLKRHFGSDF